jgi:hypothetical protein
MELSPSWEASSWAATQKISNILWKPKVQYRVHKSPPLVPTLIQINPAHITPSYLKSILILSAHLRLGIPSGFYPSGFPINILYAFLFSPIGIFLNVNAPTEDKIDDMKDSFYEELERVLGKFPKYHMKISLGIILVIINICVKVSLCLPRYSDPSSLRALSCPSLYLLTIYSNYASKLTQFIKKFHAARVGIPLSYTSASNLWATLYHSHNYLTFLFGIHGREFRKVKVPCEGFPLYSTGHPTHSSYWTKNYRPESVNNSASLRRDANNDGARTSGWWPGPTDTLLPTTPDDTTLISCRTCKLTWNFEYKTGDNKSNSRDV